LDRILILCHSAQRFSDFTDRSISSQLIRPLKTRAPNALPFKSIQKDRDLTPDPARVQSRKMEYSFAGGVWSEQKANDNPQDKDRHGNGDQSREKQRQKHLPAVSYVDFR
jgi:hypothetical protein